MILFGLIFFLIFFIIAYKFSLKIENSLNSMINKEQFSNIHDNNNFNIKNECKDIEENYNNTLTTPIAVNIPNAEYKNIFNIGENNYINNNKKKKYNCFNIKQFKYDNVYNGHKINNKINNNNYQHINWDTNSTTIDKNLKYDINKLIRKPEKNLKIGYEIINLYNWNNINDYNNKLVNINCKNDSYSIYDDVYVV